MKKDKKVTIANDSAIKSPEHTLLLAETRHLNVPSKPVKRSEEITPTSSIKRQKKTPIEEQKLQFNADPIEK